ncbi:MAG: transposase [Leptospirales bacterium]
MEIEKTVETEKKERWTVEEQALIVRRYLKDHVGLADLAEVTGSPTELIFRWAKHALEGVEQAFSGETHRQWKVLHREILEKEDRVRKLESVVIAVALAARVKRAVKEFVGDQHEIYLLDEQPGEETPYERLLGNAMDADYALFTRENAMETVCGVVDPVLESHQPALAYKPGNWGPKQDDALSAADGIGHNPRFADATSD